MPDVSDTDRKMLVRLLAGDLPPDQADRLTNRLDANPALRKEMRRLESVHRTVGDVQASFADGFAGRVAARLQPDSLQLDSLQPDPNAPLGLAYDVLRPLFLRVALASLLLIAGIGGYNAARYQTAGASSSLVEAALGLPEANYRTVVETDMALPGAMPDGTD